jgi:hypothetical protein
VSPEQQRAAALAAAVALAQSQLWATPVDEAGLLQLAERLQGWIATGYHSRLSARR